MNAKIRRRKRWRARSKKKRDKAWEASRKLFPRWAGEYVMFDEKSGMYWGDGFNPVPNKKNAGKMNGGSVGTFLYWHGSSGAWRPIRVS